MVTIAGFVILVLVILTSKIFYRSVITPLGIYFGIWIVSFSLYQLRLIRYRDSSDFMLFLLFSSFLTFFLGSMTEVLQFSKSKGSYRVPMQTSLERFKRKVIRNEGKILWLIRIFLLVSFLGTILLWINLHSIFGSFGKIFSHGFLIKQEKLGRIVFANYMSDLAYPAAFLSICYIGFVDHKRLICYLPILCAAVRGLSLFGRGPILIGILIYINGYLLIRLQERRRPFKFYLVTSVILLICFTGSNFLLDLRVGNMRSPYRAYVNRKYLDRIDKVPRFLGSQKSLLAAYHYFSGPFAAFDATLQNRDAYYLGQASFTPFFRFLSKIKLANDEDVKKMGLRQVVRVPAPVLLATYLSGAYLDFGVMGVLFLPYILGFVSTGYYFRLVRRPAFLSLFLNIILLVFIEFSVLINVFRWTSMVITLVVIVLLGLYLDKQSTRTLTTSNSKIQPIPRG